MSSNANTRTRTAAALAAAVPALAVTLGACGFELDVEFGKVETRTYEVEAFDRIDIGSAFEAEIVVGEATEVVIETGENVHEKLDVRVDDGELIIDLSSITFSGSGPMKAQISTPSLEGLEVSGASTIEVSGVDAYDFDLEVSGASDVDLEGSIAKLELDASGASNLDLDGADIGEANIDVSGASNVDISSAFLVKGDAGGASTVDVGADANVSVDTSGASSIDR